MHALLVKIILIYSVIVTHPSWGDEQLLSRNKRFLIWEPGNTKIQVITGVGVPIDLDYETAIIAWVIKTNYQLPTNASVYTQNNVFYARRRKRSPLSRWGLYKLLAQAYEMKGLDDGRPCILRAICQMAAEPVDKNNGLFDEILHTIFTPTATEEELSHHTDNEYFAAQKLGREREADCATLFPGCSFDFLDLITEKLDNFI